MDALGRHRRARGSRRVSRRSSTWSSGPGSPSTAAAGVRRPARTSPSRPIRPPPSAARSSRPRRSDGRPRRPQRCRSRPCGWHRSSGPHVPSPLGRLLRLPVVPVSLLADPAFSVIDDQDAATAVVAAAAHRFDGPVNVVVAGRRHGHPGRPDRRTGGLPADRPRVAHRPRRQRARSVRRSPRTSTSSSTGAARPTAASRPRRSASRPALSTHEVVHALVRVGDGDPPAPVGGGGVSVVSMLRRHARRGQRDRPVGDGSRPGRAGQALAPGAVVHAPSAASTTSRPTGPALLVANRRLLAATPLLVATAIGRATGREVRFTGIADLAPIGPALPARRRRARPPGRGRRPPARRSAPRGLVRAALVEAGRCRARALPGCRDARRARR